MRKRIFAIALCVVFCLSGWNGLRAQALEEGVLEYEQYNGTVIITKCKASAQGVVEVPSELNGDPVTEIQSAAFQNCTEITAVILPSSVTKIGEEAFYQCTSLEAVTLSEGLESIGTRAFSGCTQLKDITLPDTLCELGDYAFQNCSALPELRIPDEITVLGEGIVSGCTSLEVLTLPAQTEAVGARFAQNCSALQSLDMPETVASIGDRACSGCDRLTEIHFAGDAPEIGSSCFEQSIVVLYFREGTTGWTEPTWNGYQTKCEAAPEVTGITLSQSELSLHPGETTMLTAEVQPEGAASVSWTSSAPKIASVEDGVVTAESEGQAVITASAGSCQASCQVTVTESPAPQEVVLSATELSLYAGETAVLTAEVLPEQTSDWEVIWSSSDESVATVQDGSVTAVGGGTACITAQAGTAEDFCTVSVLLCMPELLSAESDCRGVTIRWKPVSGAERYQILRRLDGDWEQIAETVGQESDAYTDETGIYGTTYQYTVRACGGTAVSEFDEAGVTGTRVLSQPVLSGIEQIDYQTLKLTWESVSGAETYRVYRKSGDSDWKRIAETEACSYEDHGLSSGTKYTYTVRALYQDQISSYDTEGISGTPTIPAPELRSASAGDGGIVVKWGFVPDCSGYRIYRKTDDSDWKLIKVTSKITAHYTDVTAQAGTTYTYTVRAYCTVDGEIVKGSYDAGGISATA